MKRFFAPFLFLFFPLAVFAAITTTGANTYYQAGGNGQIEDGRPNDPGTLTIDGGSSLTNVIITIAPTNIPNFLNGVATVTGAGSSWTVGNTANSGFLWVGSRGNGTVNILLGGTVTSYDNELGVNGGAATGTVNISNTAGDGNVSTWNAYNTEIGSLGQGTVTVGSGGAANFSVETDLGYQTGSSGALNIQGGTVNVLGDFNVGLDGSGGVTVSNGGTLNVGTAAASFGAGDGTISLGTLPASANGTGSGVLNIGAAAGSAPAAAGMVNAAIVTGGGEPGTLLVNFNHTDSNYVFAPQLAGTLSVQQIGSGKTTLAGASSYSGGTTVTAGILAAGNASAFGIGAVSVQGGLLDLGGYAVTNAINVTGGILQGAGGAGAVSIGGGGELTLGSSHGLFAAQSLTLNSGSLVSLSIGGLARGSSYDGIDVSGALTAGGTLSVTLNGGFSAAAGDSFNVLTWGSETGRFSAVDLPTLTGGLLWDTSTLYSDGTIAITESAVPEPASYAAIFGFLALGFAGLRKFRPRSDLV